MARHICRMPWAPVLLGLTLVSLLSACQTTSSDPAETATSPDAPSAITEEAEIPQTVPDTEADAIVSAVESLPVWVQPLATQEEQPAIPGTSMTYGDAIRTEGEGLVQVDLANGQAFRIGGDARLVLQPDNRLNFETGEMLTWVEPGRQVPTEIVTPAGIAGLRGTTLFIAIPPTGDGEVLFLSWEGTIRLQVAEGAEEIVLQSGEALQVRPGDRDVAALRSRVRRLGRQEIRQRRRKSRLLNRFQQPLPTEAQIEATLESAP
ncbi:MAG: FecR domain-containing protein [Leptolyngbya sp. SIO1E4]|nr:FecR domain-containing protein [Leptolyngbya sp. SIO1E4]